MFFIFQDFTLIPSILVLFYYYLAFFPLSLQYKLKSPPSIFLGIISTKDSERQNIIMKNWLNKLQKPHEYAFISTPSKTNKYEYLEPDKELISLLNKNDDFIMQNQDRAAKRITGMRYFLQNTSHDYYWSITDDVVVDIDEFDRLIIYLMENYNSFHDKVFIGQNLGTFIQGGTGFIISRYAAEIVLSISKEWIKNMTKEDDVETDKFRQILEIEQKETFCPFFFGEDPLIFIIEEFWKRNFSICDNKNYPWSPNFKLIDLLALHTRTFDAFSALLNLKQAKKESNNLYFRYEKTHFELCRGSNYSNSPYTL